MSVLRTSRTLGAWLRITGPIANQQGWASAPQAQCGPDDLVRAPILLVSDWDDSIILTTVSSFLCSIIVGQKHACEWKLRHPGQPPPDMDYQYWYLKRLFDACSPAGRFFFETGARQPTMDGAAFNDGEELQPRDIDDNWGTYDCYPRPDVCARIWRRLFQLAPPAAPSVGHRRKTLTAVTINSLLDNGDRLTTERIRVGCHNCWTQLLGPGIPAVVVPTRSLYNCRCPPPPQLLLPNPTRRVGRTTRDGACWINPTGLLALQRGIRVSKKEQAARIGDCWMEHGQTVSLEEGREVVVWKIRKATQKDKQAASGWFEWSPPPGEVLTYFVDVPWVVGMTE